MLYRTLKRMIERGQTEGLESKMDIFFAASKLTEEEYTELLGMLPGSKAVSYTHLQSAGQNGGR